MVFMDLAKRVVSLNDLLNELAKKVVSLNGLLNDFGKERNKFKVGRE